MHLFCFLGQLPHIFSRFLTHTLSLSLTHTHTKATFVRLDRASLPVIFSLPSLSHCWRWPFLPNRDSSASLSRSCHGWPPWLANSHSQQSCKIYKISNKKKCGHTYIHRHLNFQALHSREFKCQGHIRLLETLIASFWTLGYSL